MFKTALKFAAFAIVAASAAAPFAAAQSTTTTVTANPTSGTYGTPVTLSGAITGGTSGAVRFPAGSLTFKDGTTSLGTAAITSDAFTKSSVVPLTSFAGTGATAVPYMAPILGDLNGDGKQDILMPTSSNFAVWLNNGDGTYTLKPAQPYLLISPALIDYNGDGKTDVLEITNKSLQVLLGDGTGVFAAPVAATAISTTAVPVTGPQALATVDLTGSGHLDVVLGYASTLSNSCATFPSGCSWSTATYRNHGDGTFGTPSVLTNPVIASVETNPSGFQIADFNGDGKPDILQQTTYQYPTNPPAYTTDVLLNDGTGTLSVGQLNLFGGSAAGQAAIGDFGNRGKLDVIQLQNPQQLAGNPSPISKYLLAKGNGDGTFAASVQIASTSTNSIYAITGVDLNADGKLDLVDAKGIAFMGNGDLTFGASVITLPYPTGPLPYTAPNADVALTADVNGDGINDVLFQNSLSNPVEVLLGNANGSAALAPISTFAVGTHSITGVYTSTGPLTGSTSAPVTVTITQQSSMLTATSSTAGVLVTLPVPLSVKVTAAGGTPTGTVTFTEGTTALGTATVDGSDNAAINYTFSTVGTQTVTATYSGDANTTGSSTTVAATTLAPVTTMPMTGGTTLSTTQGGTATAAIAVASQAGFSGTVTLSCSGLPSGAACSFNPSSITVAAGATANSTMTVTPPPTTTSRNSLPFEKTGEVLAAGLLCGMGALFKRRRMAAGALLLLAVAFISSLTGCSNSSTPMAKSYNFNVVATSGTTQTMTPYTLNVQ